MKPVLAIVMLACLSAPAAADVLYEQPPNPAGGSHMTAWWDPDGSNYDHYVWDAFTLGSGGVVRAIQWRGTYGASGPATNFTVGIYGSIPAGTQPDFSQPPLLEVDAGSNAGQTFAGIFGGAAMYEHSFTLPVPFTAQAGVKYWVQIEAWQPGFPDWAIAAGLAGDGSHFLCEHNNVAQARGVPTGCWFTTRTGDAAFRLISNVPVGVGPRPANFALAGVVPNPSRGDRMDVSFSLPDGRPARLGLFDVSGRCRAFLEVGELGAGPHVVDLASRGPIESGVYLVRLIRGEQVAEARVVIVQ